MGFLDNSGDIILDAVLTDAGRNLLARGDNSFNIAKFALADDEIDYGLYDKTHLSGNQYYDLEILQTPVLEAFTNNTSTMNSKLVTIASNNQYYMPVVKLKQTGNWGFHPSTSAYIIAVNDDTVRYIKNDLPFSNSPVPMGVGILNGYQPTEPGVADGIRADQGIDNTARPATAGLLPIDLTETEYYLLMDNRLGSPRKLNGTAGPTYSYLDDDNIASYLLTLTDYLTDITDMSAGSSPIAGERGNKAQFRVQASATLQNSQDLFERIGTQVAGTSDITTTAGGQNLTYYWYIDSTIRLIGITTGYRIDIPVRYVRRCAP